MLAKGLILTYRSWLAGYVSARGAVVMACYAILASMETDTFQYRGHVGRMRATFRKGI